MLFGFPAEFLRKEGEGIILAEGCIYGLRKHTAFHRRLSHLQDTSVFSVYTACVPVE